MLQQLIWTLRPFVLAAALAGLSSAAGSQEPASGYIIQAGDVLQVSVWNEKDLQQDALVRPDGVLSFPLVGDIAAAGNSVEHVRKTIGERLEKYVPGAVVTVSVKGTAGNRYYVIGKVARPGEFALNGPLDVMQALSVAGGGTTFADLNDIRILRRDGSRQIVLRFDYKTVASGRDLSQNILLQSGDTIVVP
jgi:polysaccharide biosynthesis/export protein